MDARQELAELEELDALELAAAGGKKVPAVAAQPKQSPGFLTKTRQAIEGVFDPIAATVAGAGQSVLLPVATAAADIYSRARGTAPIAKQVHDDLQAATTWRPRTDVGAERIADLGSALEKSKLAGLPVVGQELPAIARAMQQQLPRARIAAEAAKDRGVQAATSKLASAGQRALADAPSREIIAAGQAEGLKFVPSTVNPTRTAKMAETFIGKNNVENAISLENQPIIQRMVREDIGLPEGTHLVGKVFDDAAEAAAGPYREAATVGRVAVDEGLIGDIENLTWAQKYSPEVKAAAKAEAVDDLTRRLQAVKSMTGEETVALIKDYRKKATDMHNKSKMGAADETSGAMAEAYDNAARAMENFLERNSPAELVPRLREARTKIAKIRDYERATDLATGAVNINSPSIVNRATEGKPLSGKMETLAKVAALSKRSVKTPEEMGAQTMSAPYSGHSMIQGGLAGLGGAAFGVPGAIAGYALAPALTSAAKTALTKKLLSSKTQSKLLKPQKGVPLREGAGYQPHAPWNEMLTPETGPRFLPQIEGAPVASAVPEQSVPLNPLVDENGVPWSQSPMGAEMGGIQMPEQAMIVKSLRRGEAPQPAPVSPDDALAIAAQQAGARQSLMESELGAGGGAGARPFGGEGPPNPPPRGGGMKGWQPDPASIDYPLQAELHKRYLGPIQEAMMRGDEAMMAQLEAAFQRDLAALNSQSSFDKLYNPQSGRAQAASAALRRSNQFDPSISQSQIPPFQGAQ